MQAQIDFEKVGERVKAARIERNITQEELCEKCGCTTSHLSRLENGKAEVSLELLFKLSIELEKSMDYFVMDTPNADPSIKIEQTIAGKLSDCTPQTLNFVEQFLDVLLEYQNSLDETNYLYGKGKKVF